jgi:hypothetical protein
MGLIDDKKNVFTEIGAYNSLREQQNLPDNTNVFTSVNNSNDVSGYLVDLLKLINGSEAVKKSTGQMFTDVLQKVEPDLKTQLKKQAVTPSSNNNLPSDFKNNGYIIPLSNIDTYGKYKTNPNSKAGDLLYNKQSNDFDFNVHQAIANPNTDITYNNTMVINYNDNIDSITVKPSPSASSNNISNFLILFIDGLILFSIKELVTKILNNLFGTVTFEQKKSKSQLINEIKTDTLLQKIINNDPNISINNNELNNIENKADELNKGVSYNDVGCGILQLNLPFSGLTLAVSTISGSTDPTLISNTFDNTISSTITNNSNSDTSINNQQTIKDGFFTRIINLIILAVTQSVTSTPQIKLLQILISKLNNNGQSNINGNPENDIKNNSILINCISNTVKSAINKFLFDTIKKAMLSLIIPAAKKIAMERINNYTGIIQSLLKI